MNYNWKDVEWIFEPDGSLLDIYVQEISLKDWRKLIDLLNSKYSANIDPERAIEYLTDQSGEMDTIKATVYLNNVQVNCHFFLPEEIELDIDPKEINSIEEFQKVIAFMEDISNALSKQVTLTGENSPKYPLVKVDSNKGIIKALSKDEAQKYFDKQNLIKRVIRNLILKIEMKFFRKRMVDRLIRSASEPHKSTKKDDNVW